MWIESSHNQSLNLLVYREDSAAISENQWKKKSLHNGGHMRMLMGKMLYCCTNNFSEGEMFV